MAVILYSYDLSNARRLKKELEKSEADVLSRFGFDLQATIYIHSLGTLQDVQTPLQMSGKCHKLFSSEDTGKMAINSLKG